MAGGGMNQLGMSRVVCMQRKGDNYIADCENHIAEHNENGGGAEEER